MALDKGSVKNAISEKSTEFIFKLKNGMEIARANNLKDFVFRVKEIAAESLEYHTYNGHFGSWLRYFNRFELAEKIDSLKSNGERLREDILRIIGKI